LSSEIVVNSSTVLSQKKKRPLACARCWHIQFGKLHYELTGITMGIIEKIFCFYYEAVLIQYYINHFPRV
jgi:hypothetical protein